MSNAGAAWQSDTSGQERSAVSRIAKRRIRVAIPHPATLTIRAWRLALSFVVQGVQPAALTWDG
jgi:hypothetical protein